MVNGLTSSLSKVVAPGKGSEPLILVFHGVYIILIFLTQHIEQEVRITLCILVGMVEDSGNTLCTSSTLSLSHSSIKADSTHPLLIVVKGIIGTL